MFICKSEAINYHSYIVYEKNSGRIIDGYNYDSKHLTASIVKVLTAIIVIEEMSLDKTVKADSEAINQEGSKVYLKLNESYTIEYLLYGMLLRSGNDCANLLARSCFGSIDSFVYYMNKYAEMLNMTNSTFNNPTGLDSESENYSTCLDMARLMSYCLDNKKFVEISSTIEYKGLRNKHKLICLDSGFICGKTGYTKKCGRTLITTSKKDNIELVCVTFEMPGDFSFHKLKLTEALKNYKVRHVLKKGYVKQNITELDYLLYYDDLYLPKKRFEKFTYKIILNKEIMIVYSNNLPILEVSLKREEIKV